MRLFVSFKKKQGWTSNVTDKVERGRRGKGVTEKGSGDYGGDCDLLAHE